MTNDNADDPTRARPPQGSSPYDQPSPWSTPPPGPSSAPPGSGPDMPPPPYGQQYGSPPQYGQPPYGQQQYGGQPYPGQPHGYGPGPEATKVRSSATLWLILNIAGVLLWGWLLGGLLGIVGAIFAGVALGEAQTDTTAATRKVRLAKIFFWVGLALAIALVVLGIIGLFALRNSGYDGRFGGNV